MATMYDISVASMKIGIACPIPNNSFRFWDDPGTWVDPSAWTATNVSVARQGKWTTFGTGYDDDRSMLYLYTSSAPDDTSYRLVSTPVMFWQAADNDLSTTQAYYYSLAANYSIGTGGANKKVVLYMTVGTSSTLGTSSSAVIKEWTTGTGGSLVLYTGSVTPTTSAGYDWFAFQAYIRNVSTLTYAYLDTIGIMFNPIDGTGYYTLTNVFPANGPSFAPEHFIETTRTPLGITRRYDISGGNEKYRIELELRDESATTYQYLKRFWDYNRGTPGINPYPLLIEPNIPSLPPTLMVNFVGNRFPLTRQTSRAQRYGGVVTFETIY